MPFKIFLPSVFAVIFLTSLLHADIYVKQDEAAFAHPSGSPLKFASSKKIKILAVSHNGTEITLNPQAAYTFNEVNVGGKKSLQIDMFKNSSLEMGDTVITNKGSKAVLMMTPKEGSNKVNIQIISGKVSVKSHGSDKEREIAAASDFSIFNISEIASDSDGAHYKFEEDLTKPVSSANP